MKRLITNILINISIFFVLSTIIKYSFNDMPLQQAMVSSLLPTLIYGVLSAAWYSYLAKKKNRV